MRKRGIFLACAGLLAAVVCLCSQKEVFPQRAVNASAGQSEASILDEAGQLFQRLQEWEETGDWDAFFAQKDSYRSRIESAVQAISKDPVVVVKARYLAWKTALLFNSAPRVAFEDFVGTLARLDSSGQEVLAAIEEVIRDLHRMERPKLKSQVAAVYKGLLLESGTPILLRRQADAFLADGDVDSAVSLYRSYIDRLEDKERTAETRRLLQLFADTGFNTHADASFAEELFSRLSMDDQASGTAGLLYLRAYNAERLGDYARAVDLYERLLKEYPGSPLHDEVAFRCGSLLLFKLSDRAQAKVLLLNVRDSERYDVVMPLSVINETFISDDYNFKSYVDAVTGTLPLLGRNSAAVYAPRTKLIVGQPVTLSALGITSDTGCMVPQGLFLWSGDLDGTQIMTNTAEIRASYATPGVKSVNLVQQGAQGVIGFDHVLMDVYAFDINISGSPQAGVPVQASMNIVPSLSPDLVEVRWKIDDVTQHDLSGSDVEVIFGRDGAHTLTASVEYFGMEIAKSSATVVVGGTGNTE